VAHHHDEEDKTQSFAVIGKDLQIGHYKIVERIGVGGMGEVYLAEDTELNRQVALKFLPYETCQDEDCRARFIREAKAAAKLIHPNIVTIHEVSEFKGRPYFAMDYCEGQTLLELIKAQRLTIDQIIDLAIHICEGLQEAHEAGIIHRDIKPSNIILDAKGRPKLVDFGLAAVRGMEKITKKGSTLGTIGYMSPEQVKGEQVDRRSDLFSLGILLYEMIAGRRPFMQDSNAAEFNAIINNTPEPLLRYKADIPENLQRIVTKLLEKNPDLRYQGASDVMADLKKSALTQELTQKRGFWWKKGVFALGIVAVMIIIGYKFYGDFLSRLSRPPDSGRKMLVVLPFENLGNPDEEYFTDGMTDEIISRLASINSLGVISRTSAFAYKSTNKILPEIAKELGVDYVLEGSVRWDKSGGIEKVRILPQLICVSDDSHIWSKVYERDLMEVFAVQSEIASEIARALDTALLESEKKEIDIVLTKSSEAYHYYLRAKEHWNNARSSDLAIKMLEKAVAIDSNFSQAYSMLTKLYGYEYLNNLGQKELRYQQAMKAAEKAFQMSNGHVEGYIARGYFLYYCNRDYDQALEQFSSALKQKPNSSELLDALAFVLRRQGRWEEALENQRLAHQLDPRNFNTVDGMVRTLYLMHHLDEAMKIVRDGLEWAPDNERMLIWNVMLVGAIGADFEEIRAATKRLQQFARAPVFNYWAEKIDRYLRDYESALSRRNEPGDYAACDSVEFYLGRGEIYSFLGEKEISRQYYDSVRLVCEGRLTAQPDNAWHHIDLATAYAGLGRIPEALDHGARAMELLPVSRDALHGVNILHSMTVVYTMVGKYEEAIDLLEYLLTHPSSEQINFVRFHPQWDPLRSHLRFQALLKNYESGV